MSNTTIVRLALSHNTLEEIALDAAALSQALGIALDQSTSDKLRDSRIATPNIGEPPRALFGLDDILPDVLW